MKNRMRYMISSLPEISQCMSNTSNQLHLEVRTFTATPVLSGVQVCVEHDTYGLLAAFMLGPSGTLTELPEGVALFTVEQVLNHLKVFGFDITYNPAEELPEETGDFLYALRSLGVNMIRILSVQTQNDGVHQVPVAFKSEELSDWVLPGFVAKKEDYLSAVLEGHAVRIDQSASGQVDWSWLNGVANIDNILKQNGWVI